MNAPTKGMNIKSVAQLSGVSEHTLRAWERRYGVIAPLRSDGGHRLYSIKDVEKLKLLSHLIGRGHAIGTLAGHSLDELYTLVEQGDGLKASRPEVPESLDPESPPLLNHNYLKTIVSALVCLDFEQLDRLLLKSRLETPVRTFVLGIVSPLLGEVGKLVEKGHLDIAQEHALSAILRNHLGDILVQIQKTTLLSGENQGRNVRILFATPEGELHEFGILIAAILAGSHGHTVCYLGPNMPARNLAKAAISVGANILVVGAANSASHQKTAGLQAYLKELVSFFDQYPNPEFMIWLGGSWKLAAESNAHERKVLHLDSLKAFEGQLMRTGDSPARTPRKRA